VAAGALAAQLLDAARSGGPGWERLAGELDEIDPAGLAGDEERLAFWINLYNALLLRALGTRRRHGHLLRHLRMFRRTACTLGGDAYSLDLIEHGILRLNARPPTGLRPLLRADDSRLRGAPSRLDPRIHFALNCGARSCPGVRTYAAEKLDEQLSASTRDYMAAESDLDRAGGTVLLPALVKLYGADFGPLRQRLQFAAAHLAEAEWITGEGVTVRYGSFDWRIAP
jgi:hypothetical protein